MEIKVFKVGKEKPEEVEIRCHELTEEVREIVAFVKTRQGQITGLQEGKQFEIAVTDLAYVEAVDNKVFLYTQKQVYETRQKLYELEELLREKYFLRVSKSLLLNLMKVQSLRPAMNGRMLAVLKGGEEIIITRKYVADLKKAIRGERGE